MPTISKGNIAGLFRMPDTETPFDRELHTAVTRAIRRQRTREAIRVGERLPGAPKGYPSSSFRN